MIKGILDNDETTNTDEPSAENTNRTDDKPVLFAASTDSSAETIRKTGLAWSAAIALFASVMFCLIIGWMADLLLGSSPWGVVTGIVVGGIIGFIQFFRLTSQIFRE